MVAMEALAKSLAEYATLDSSELGEYLDALLGLARKEGEMGAGLHEALLAEMQTQLEWLQANGVIEDEEVTFVRKRRVLRFLN
jgi:hypothetical protein